MSNMFKIDGSLSGTGFAKPYKTSELALISHASLIAMFDPGHDGYVQYSLTDKVLGVRDVKLGTLWTPRITTEASLQFVEAGPDDVRVLKYGDDANMRFSGPTGADIPAGSFTLFGCWRSTAAENAYPIGSGDTASPVAIGYTTDFKARFATRYSGTVSIEATASVVANRLSLFVAEWDSGAGTGNLWVDGVKVLNAVAPAAPNHTDRRLTVGGLKYSSDPHGVLVGQFAFGGVMNGIDAAFEPLIRAFAKERFPTGMAHAA